MPISPGEYAAIQKQFESMISRSTKIQELAEGQLPWQNLQNIVSQNWKIVYNFPTYLEHIANRINKFIPDNRLRRLLMPILEKDIREEIGHRELWRYWALESNVRLSRFGFNPQMKALHEYLLECVMKLPTPHAIGSLNVGIEGTVGVLVSLVYEGIIKIHQKNNNGKKLTNKGAAWLNVHLEHDFDKHPVQGLKFIHLLKPADPEYEKIIGHIMQASKLFVRAFDEACTVPYKPRTIFRL